MFFLYYPCPDNNYIIKIVYSIVKYFWDNEILKMYEGENSAYWQNGFLQFNLKIIKKCIILLNLFVLLYLCLMKIISDEIYETYIS